MDVVNDDLEKFIDFLGCRNKILWPDQIPESIYASDTRSCCGSEFVNDSQLSLFRREPCFKVEELA